MKTPTPATPFPPSKSAQQNTTSELTSDALDALQLEWLNCFPAVLSDLFFYQTVDGLKLFTTYELALDAIDKIINTLGGINGNVSQIAVIMGCKSVGDNRDFQPILEVTLYEAVEGADVYYFLMNGIKDAIVIPQDRLNSFAYTGPNSNVGESFQQISPKIAEILMMNWASLTNDELVNAFDALSPESVELVDSSNGKQILFGSDSVRRVRQYIYGEEESLGIIAELVKRDKEDINLSFKLRMSSGLTIANIHPFNFRPIINIHSNSKHSKNKLTSRRNIIGSLRDDSDDENNAYFDTSRPCPPFCKPRNDG